MFVALVSPIHPWGEVLFSVHMTQHEILMLVAAPLFVLSRPLAATVWAFPLNWRRKIGSGTNANFLQKTGRFLTKPFVAFAVHDGALWIWHVPALFQATLRSDAVHTFQHLSFFLSALLFWWSLLHHSRGASGYGAGILYLFTTSIHTGLLGALLTFSTSTFYPDYAKTTASWGLSPLEDQQLGGLIMWIPAGLVYMFAALIMFAGWMTDSEKRVQFREKQAYDTAAKTSAASEIIKQGGALDSVKLILVIGAAVFFTVFQACSNNSETEHAASEMTGGDVAHGRAIIREQGCASCHTIPGIRGAQANVGPSLEKIGGRTYIAGVLENNPENMVRWLENPPGVDDKTAMPNLGLSQQDARDVATYLYILKQAIPHIIFKKFSRGFTPMTRIKSRKTKLFNKICFVSYPRYPRKSAAKNSF